MAIWGWMPRYFVSTKAILGTRDSISQFQIEPRPFRDYYRRRYMKDIEANHPKFFLDAVGGRSDFKFHDRRTEGHETFPDLANFIDAHYELVAEILQARLYQWSETDVPLCSPNEREALREMRRSR